MQTAEKIQVLPFVLEKSFFFDGQAVDLYAVQHDQQITIQCTADKTFSQSKILKIKKRIQAIFGFQQSIQTFEAKYRHHQILGKFIQCGQRLYIPLSATPFEALIWAITSQQINMKAAITLRRKLIQFANIKRPNGLLCHPDAEHIYHLNPLHLKQLGYSTTKTNAIIASSRLIYEHKISFQIPRHSIGFKHLIQQLLKIKGIGPWTAHYTLLRGLGWLDASLHQDAGIRQALCQLLKSSLSKRQIHDWLLQFQPWRSLVALYLWKSLEKISI